MEFTIEENDVMYLMHCIYLGQYVANAARLPDRRLREYDLLAEKLYARYLSAKEEIPVSEVTPRQISDLRDRILDEVAEHLEIFERDVLREKLSELL